MCAAPVNIIDLPRVAPWPLPTCSQEPMFIATLINVAGNKPDHLVQHLVHIQLRFGWISPCSLAHLSTALQLSIEQIRSVIQFYVFLTDVYQGQYRVLFSNNITDQMQHQQQLAEQLCRILHVAPGQLRSDSRVSVDFCSCTGLGDQGPAILVNGYAITALDQQRIGELAALIENQVSIEDWPESWFRVTPGIRQADVLLTSACNNGKVLEKALTKSTTWLLDELECSSLRGRGGAGFSTFRKMWSTCQQASGNAHYVVCNADEGEPGTFKDRTLLMSCPDQVFEGMTLAAWVIGAHQGFLYLRGEYAFLYEPLQRCLEKRRKRKLLGEDILGQTGFDFDISIHLGAGAYICGEESALIESLEGKRGVPRIRPPFPVTNGYMGQPTLVNNVETFACVTDIANRGGAAFAAKGTQTASGTKLHSISGDCLNPGVYEWPWGLTIAEALKQCGGESAQAVQIGGPAGTLLFADEFDRHLDFADVATGGSFMVFGPERDLMTILTNFADFFAHESCGFCTPCRVGTQQLSKLISRYRAGLALPKDQNLIQELANVMEAGSHCGLGRTAAQTIRQALAKRPNAFEAGLQPSLIPAFDVSAATLQNRAQREASQ